VTLTFDLWSWTFAVNRLWRDETRYQIWTQSSNLRRSHCDLNIWPNDLVRRVTCCTGLWDDFHQTWPSTTDPWLNYSVFWCWYVWDLDLWPADLESSWYIKRHVIKVCTKFKRNQAIPGWIIDNFANFCTRYVALWSRPLNLELLQHVGYHAFKLCTKFKRNRIIHGWDWRFRGLGTTAIVFSGGAWTNFAKLGSGIGRSYPHKKFVSEFGYLAEFSNEGSAVIRAPQHPQLRVGRKPWRGCKL